MINPIANERQWNSAEATLLRINDRHNDCDIAAQEGDLIKLFRTLRVLYVNIIMFIHDKEKWKEELKEIDFRFSEAEKRLKNIDQKYFQLNVGTLEKILFDIRKKLNIIMIEEELLIPKKLKISYEEEIQGDFE